MEIEKILSRFYGSETKRIQYERWLEIVKEKLNHRSLEEAFKDINFVSSLFTLKERDVVKVSAPQYFRIKNFLVTFYEACGIRGVVPARAEINKAAVADAYFVSLEAIINFIDKVGSHYLLDYSKGKDLLIAKAIVILGWHGVSYGEMSSLKTTDLIVEDNSYYLKALGTKIRLSQSEYDLLLACGKQLNFRGVPEGKLQSINDSYYGLILPPVKKSKFRTDADYIKQYFKRFTTCCLDAFNKKIYFNNLHTNKIFAVLYEEKIKYTDLIEKISEFTDISPNSCYWIREDYCIWVNNYYPEYFKILGEEQK